MKLQNLTKSASLAIGLSLSLLQTSCAEPTAQDSETLEPQMTVFKSPTCGCCTKWVDHINENNFDTKVIEINDLTSIKDKYGIKGQYDSCHTGVVSTEIGEYVFEGHVPAEHVKAFLSNPPKGAIGLSVPGMPVGSPGMEVGDRKDYYQVLLLNEDGSSSIFAHVNKER